MYVSLSLTLGGSALCGSEPNKWPSRPHGEKAMKLLRNEKIKTSVLNFPFKCSRKFKDFPRFPLNTLIRLWLGDIETTTKTISF